MDESIKPIIYAFPIWEEQIWADLQAKRYQAAGERLQLFLLSLTHEERGAVLWSHIIEGVPLIRGRLVQDEWDEKAIRMLAAVLLNVSEGQELARVYRDLELPVLRNFHQKILRSIPQTTPQEKLSLLRNLRPTVHIFLLATPAQELGIEVFSRPESLKSVPLPLLSRQFLSLPYSLKEVMFSYQTAERLYRIASTNNLSEEKCSLLAHVVGKILLGFWHIEELKQQIEKVLTIDARVADALATATNEKILSSFVEQIQEMYTPLSDVSLDKTASVSIPVVSTEDENQKRVGSQEKDGGQQKNRIVINPALLRMQKDSGLKTQDSGLGTKDLGDDEMQQAQDKPFVLFEQKGAEALPRQLAGQGIKRKGFSMPFGFFKGSASTPAGISKSGESVRAEVRSAGETPAPQKPRVVHYSGERTQVTPFAQEEELFAVQDSGQRTEDKGQRTENKEVISANNGLDANKRISKSTPQPIQKISLQVEAPAKSGEVQIRKNPFSFPGSQQNVKPDGKPKVEGNVVNLK
ncbi:MAG: hypothetical protein Q8P01_05305 [bacterium]|nr:hypothetical protein [bacterium]